MFSTLQLNNCVKLYAKNRVNARLISFITKKDEKALEEKLKDDIIAADAEVPDTATSDFEIEAKKLELEKKRNRSNLTIHHRNILLNKMPYSDSQSWIHETIKYKRMMYGRYGKESGVNPSLLFYSKSELKSQNDYERVAFPHTLKEMLEKNAQEKRAKELEIEERENQIAKKLEKLKTWQDELNAKIAKKAADAKAAKDRKERLIEEVRRQLGYKVDPREDKFKEALEAKEREDKKKMKEAKRKVKEETMMKKLSAKQSSDSPSENKVEDLKDP